MNNNRVFECAEIAELWEDWLGVNNKWSNSLRLFGELGGKIKYYCGYPQSKSAIPLTFSLIMPDGTKLEGKSRLKDINTAVEIAAMQIH